MRAYHMGEDRKSGSGSSAVDRTTWRAKRENVDGRVGDEVKQEASKRRARDRPRVTEPGLSICGLRMRESGAVQCQQALAYSWTHARMLFQSARGRTGSQREQSTPGLSVSSCSATNSLQEEAGPEHR